jgi:hypothetical protein
MLQGLPVIRLKSVKLVCTVLQNISTPRMHLRVLPSSGWIHQHHLQVSSTSRPSHGASSVPRLDARCKCMNTWEYNR